jgi:hypothetical protein
MMETNFFKISLLICISFVLISNAQQLTTTPITTTQYNPTPNTPPQTISVSPTFTQQSQTQSTQSTQFTSKGWQTLRKNHSNFRNRTSWNRTQTQSTTALPSASAN